MSDDAADYIAQPTEGGVERSILHWLRNMLGQFEWEVYGLTVDYRVRRSKRAKKARIDVGMEGVKVVVPASVQFDPELFLTKNAEWVLRHHEKYESYREQIPERRFEEGEAFPYMGETRIVKIKPVDEAEVTDTAFVLPEDRVAGSSIEEGLEALYRRSARAHFTRRVDHFAEKMGLRYSQIQIRNQKTRWGSYSQKTGTLSLNWRLIMAPPEIIDYLLVHELAHAEVPNHGNRFWRLVAQYVPDYKEKDRWLKENGVKLVF